LLSSPAVPGLTVWSRSPRSVAALRATLRSFRRGLERRIRVERDAVRAVRESDVVLLCVADRAVAPLVRELALELRSSAEPAADRARRRRPVVLLANGYLSLRVLAPLEPLGFTPGRLHPLVPVPRVNLRRFQRKPFAVEGGPRALRAARLVLRWMECDALPIRSGSAPRYHAAAALLGGGLSALFRLAEQGMASGVRSRSGMRRALQTFVADVAREIGRAGPIEALSGPLARGSEELVRGHLRALGRIPHAREAYRVLGQVMLELALARGSIDEAARRRLARLLRARRGR